MADTRQRTDGVERLSYIMDSLFRVPGTNFRFGLDPLIGLIPGGGDVAGSVVSAYTIVAAARAGAPPTVLLRMGLNIAVDAIVGAVPLLGDLFDAGFKANRRNAALLQRYLDSPAPVQRSSRALVAAILIVLLLLFIAAAWVAVRLVAWLVAQF